MSDSSTEPTFPSPNDTFSEFRAAVEKIAKAKYAPSRQEKLVLQGHNHFDSAELTVSPDSDAVYLEGMISRDTALAIAKLICG